MEAPPFAGRYTQNPGRDWFPTGLFGTATLMFAGFLLPAITIGVELVTRLCAGAIFDPMPTLAHLAVVVAVPLVNLKLFLLRRRGAPVARAWIFAGGAAAATGFCYALLFLPIYPIAAIGIIFFGLGLLPFAPLTAGIAATLLTRGVGRLGPRPYRRLAWLGAFGGVALMLLLDVPTAITHAAVRGAVDPDATVRAHSIRLMRTFGDDELLLRLCYDSSRHTSGLLGLLLDGSRAFQWFHGRMPQDTNPLVAREVYYRVHGTTYDSVPPPFEDRGWAFAREFEWDRDRGGTVVGRRVSGLALRSSRIDGSMDADDAVGYVEWTTEFANAHAFQEREARMTIVLPPGGVVSRATLWVNGEPREAAFATRAQARRAYENVVVVQRRDPLLVTTNGADQVFVQMFPVPPGGTAKFRIGITAPLALGNDGRATLAMPAIVDRNFNIESDLHHAVWIEGDGREAVADAGFSVVTGDGSVVRRRGNFSDAELGARRPRISLSRDPRAEVIASGNVLQTIRREPREPAGSFFIVVDGSRGAAAVRQALPAALERIPTGARVGFAFAAGEDATLPLAPWNVARKQEVLARLAGLPFEGGEDNLGALAAALLALEGEPLATVLWVHGPQGFAFENHVAQLEQLLDRSTNLPQIWLLPVAAGPNKALEHARLFQLSRTLAWSDDPANDIGAAVTHYFDAAPRWVITRSAGPPAGTIVGSQHVEKLWALDRIEELMSGRGADLERAQALAAQHRLVTPVSGAVVLETDADYARAGLTPPDATAVPTIPEPSTWAMLIVACLAFAWAMRQRRRAFA